MSISIKVECDAGSDITDAFQEAILLANKLNIMVEFTFNEVICFARPNGSVRIGVEEYHEAIKSKSQYKFARSY